MKSTLRTALCWILVLAPAIVVAGPSEDANALVVLSDSAVVFTGFYEFVSLVDGKMTPRPSRFTMLVTKRDGQWWIAHHHSSPRVMPKT